MFKRDKPLASLETLIGPAVTIHGDVDFGGGLHLEGRVLGNVCLTGDGEAGLTMTETALILGEVRASHATLNGRIRGDVLIAGRLALGPKAVVEGNVYYGSIEMALGARITGKMVSGAVAGPPAMQSLNSPSSNPSLQ
jgi:cytoskeletal protein CcmA (bactofilin family)